MQIVAPRTPEDLAQTLAQANGEGKRLGRDFQLSLEHLNRIVQYTADDLTVSVEAGLSLASLYDTLAQHRQWLPIGAPRPERVTVGEALAMNPSGPFRLFYGTLRDMVIGVRFATVEGKLVKSGGQVVKNVAGYDLGKLLIGSRDTLAVLVQANFRTYPRPAFTETTTLGFATLSAALGARTAIQKSVLSPLAMDLFDAAAARLVSPQELPPGEWVLAIAYGGVARVIERYRRDIHEIARQVGMQSSATLSGHDEERLWSAVVDLPAHMEEHEPQAVRVKVASTISGIGACIESGIGAGGADAVVSRAGTGITYFYKNGAQPSTAAAFRDALAGKAESVVVEYSPFEVDRWGPTGASFELMSKVKQTLDPNGILNPGTFLGGL